MFVKTTDFRGHVSTKIDGHKGQKGRGKIETVQRKTHRGEGKKQMRGGKHKTGA